MTSMKSDPTDSSIDLIAIKTRVRARYRTIRETKTPEQVQEGSSALCRRLASWDQLCQAKRVMAYVAFRNSCVLRCCFLFLYASCLQALLQYSRGLPPLSCSISHGSLPQLGQRPGLCA